MHLSLLIKATQALDTLMKNDYPTEPPSKDSAALIAWVTQMPRDVMEHPMMQKKLRSITSTLARRANTGDADAQMHIHGATFKPSADPEWAGRMQSNESEAKRVRRGQ